jgi:hypothetical protein
MRKFAEADAAEHELTKHGAGTPTPVAPSIFTHFELWFARRLGDQRLLGHENLFPLRADGVSGVVTPKAGNSLTLCDI